MMNEYMGIKTRADGGESDKKNTRNQEIYIAQMTLWSFYLIYTVTL